MFLVFTVAVLNLGLGFALGVWLRRMAPAPGSAPILASAGPIFEPAPDAAPVEEEPETELIIAAPEHSDDIPAEWLDMLEGVEATVSFVEAAVHVFRLELGRYRDELIAVDLKARNSGDDPEQAAMEECLAELKQSNESYLARQAGAASHLGDKTGGELGEMSAVAQELTTVLMDQGAQIETTVNNIAILDFSSDRAEGCHRLTVEITKLLDTCHSVRDEMHTALLKVMQAEGRLAGLERNLRIDALTDLTNRTGLEATIADFVSGDPQRQRIVSMALADIDDLDQVNRRYGALVGDEVIAAVGRIVDDCLRKSRGYDFTARFDGQRFLIFLADTGPRNATSLAERIRQTVEQSTMEYQGALLPVTVTFGVAEFLSNDSSESIYARLFKAVREAKRAGGNCTMLDDGEGPQAITPPEYKVKGRAITLQPPV